MSRSLGFRYLLEMSICAGMDINARCNNYHSDDCLRTGSNIQALLDKPRISMYSVQKFMYNNGPSLPVDHPHKQDMSPHILSTPAAPPGYQGCRVVPLQRPQLGEARWSQFPRDLPDRDRSIWSLWINRVSLHLCLYSYAFAPCIFDKKIQTIARCHSVAPWLSPLNSSESWLLSTNIQPDRQMLTFNNTHLHKASESQPTHVSVRHNVRSDAAILLCSIFIL